MWQNANTLRLVASNFQITAMDICEFKITFLIRLLTAFSSSEGGDNLWFLSSLTNYVQDKNADQKALKTEFFSIYIWHKVCYTRLKFMVYSIIFFFNIFPGHWTDISYAHWTRSQTFNLQKLRTKKCWFRCLIDFSFSEISDKSISVCTMILMTAWHGLRVT